MKKIILFVFTLSLFLSSCSKSSNDDSSSEPKVYQVVSEARCLNNTVTDVSSFGMYIKFDSPSFTPIANKWYKVDGGFYYYKITNITPVQGQASQRVLISQHYNSYCQ
ncbi:hypothetical protein [Flavobacterium sp.]|uniref:hypothetical protein n=1 Tax=Flavobacterium sp. TaxID=239 RepID=UPI003340520F